VIATSFLAAGGRVRKATTMKGIGNILFAAAVCSELAAQFPALAVAGSKEKVLHAFTSGTNDGASPEAGLINVGGTLYGTTYGGGFRNSGVIFALDPHTGAETVLHAFGDGTDGLNPQAGLIEVKGSLYGTASSGGGFGGGAVFALDLDSGTEMTVYGFCSQQKCADGGAPQAGLLYLKGFLYGTTLQGGNDSGPGTVYAINLKTRTEAVLHVFGSGTDGVGPHSNLIDVSGTLYGTTSYGGANGGGTVFSINPDTGAERVLYSFGSGASPYSGLINVRGTLYGTAWGVGSNGAVFSIDPGTGAETVVYTFDGGTGAHPFAGLIDVKGTLYGTTSYGGGAGQGTAYAIDPNTGAETVLTSFGSDADGANPYASLIDVRGTLYGTTESGGGYGHGTVFAIKRP
jgi:uncharacterized repeat protein (TIGR03803 family)